MPTPAFRNRGTTFFFLRTGSAKGPIDIRNFLVFVYTFCAEAPPGVSPSASWHPLPVEGFFKCLCKQRLKHSRTNTQSKKYNSHSPAQGPSLLSGQQDVLLGTSKRLPGRGGFNGQHSAHWEASEVVGLSSGPLPYGKGHTPRERFQESRHLESSIAATTYSSI